MNVRRRELSFWPRLLWSLVYPRNSQRAEPTGAGLVLVALSFGVGLAAYNSSNNILFLALSLLLASLIVSGILSWLNMRGIDVELRAPPRARTGLPCRVTVVVANRRRFFPAYDLGFELEAAPAGQGAGELVTFAPKPKAPGRLLRQVWRKLPRTESGARGTVAMGGSLHPGAGRSVSWNWTPDRRGEWEVSLAFVVSLFPFGFLRKRIARDLRVHLVAWPADIDFDWSGAALRSVAVGTVRRSALGSGPDLHSLRQYRHGDSHRLIHWKASARSGGLIVRQHAAEAAEGCWLEFDPAAWRADERFERAVSLAAGVAERLFASGALSGWKIGDGDERRTMRREDVDTFLDLLAVERAGGKPRISAGVLRGSDIVRFSPEGTEGVKAHAGTMCIARA